MNCKLRLKDPSGAEFEAEGPADFVQSEKTNFLESLKRAGAARQAQQEEESRPPGPAAAEDRTGAFWGRIVTRNRDGFSLRVKSPGIDAREAALILLAANRVLAGEPAHALELSKALRTSGYQPDRLDRLLSKEMKAGRISAAGTKRNRTYRITQKGLEHTYQAISKLLKEE